MNHKYIRMGAIGALAAVTIGVVGTTTAQASAHQNSETRASATQREASPSEAWSNYLNSPAGRDFLKQEGLTKQEATAGISTDSAANKGFLDKIKKKALNKAFNALPKAWKNKLNGWAKKGKSTFREKFNTLPSWAKKALTLGGAISAKTAAEWLFDMIL